jgi:hypothetical protein
MQKKNEHNPTIYLSFRFHVNFYHSYRGDSLDDRGIGKDIRVIRSILDDLDRLNEEGIAVRGTWDIENYYSLEIMMRRHAPDLIERIQDRVRKGKDEVELMSYNNGLISACTREEFEEQLSLSFHNEGSSGLDDLFTSWAKILRPQECMYTPSFLELYPKGGINTISLFYSAIPFNGFGSFIPPLEPEKRYNPLELRADGFDGKMLLLPCYNHGDIADRWVSLKWWVKQLRREQLRMENPKDFLLLIDMDGDDQFWAGMDLPFIAPLIPSFDGFYRLVRSVASLPWVSFTSPGAYIENHEVLGEVRINQDTADGSFDGYSSWAEKWENTALWTILQRSRDAAEYAERVLELGGVETEEIRRLLSICVKERLLTMSTTHFGMASPVMNKKRLADGFSHAEAAREAGEKALKLSLSSYFEKFSSHKSKSEEVSFLLPKQISLPGIEGVIRLESGTYLPVKVSSGEHLAEPLGKDRLHELISETPSMSLQMVPDKHRILVQEGDISWELSLPVINYHGKVVQSRIEEMVSGQDEYTKETLRIRGSLSLGASRKGNWELTLRYKSPWGGLFLDFTYAYPLTGDYGYDKKKASRLDRTWDKRWREIIPLEIRPAFDAGKSEPFKVIKYNFFRDLSVYELNYGQFSKNRNIDSFNNQITNGWVGISNRKEGLLVAQHTGLDNNFAFCPIRLREISSRQEIRLNPFGTYYGAQLCSPTAITGFGRKMAAIMGNQFDSYAPSFNGKKGRFSLMIAGFKGPLPPEDLQKRALLFSAAPLRLG